jgi:hypothetical protein
MGTFAPGTVEFCALALQPPLELGAIHGLRVHINVYHVKYLRWGTCRRGGGLRRGERTGWVSRPSLEKAKDGVPGTPPYKARKVFSWSASFSALNSTNSS